MKEEVGKYALTYGTNAAIKRFSTKYTQYDFIRTTVNNWKSRFANKQGGAKSQMFSKVGRPNKANDELMAKIKDVIIVGTFSGWCYFKKMVISIRNGVLKANDPNALSEFRGNITLTNDWARGVLTSMDWVKWKATGKVEPSAQFLAEEKFTFQKAISEVVYQHDTPPDLVINLDQTPLSYISPGKYRFNAKGANNVPIKGIDDKRQITATFGECSR